MATITPFVKRMRTQGGTIYTFTSALEDIGLNINERNNIVKMSHYALLDIPAIDAPNIPDASIVNRFNVFAIPGAFKSWLDSGSIKDGRVIVAESFQNYALNLETFLASSSDYNASLATTVSERVFWKWLKETGAIRWTPENTPAGLYWKEEQDSDVSVGYNSIVKGIGTISAGSVRTDSFGNYNETYVLVPTSFGQTPVWFKQVEDDNYYHGMVIPEGLSNIMGRNPYTKPHPDGLDIKAYYDLMDSSTQLVYTSGIYDFEYALDASTFSPGWWWTYQGLYNDGDRNKYYIDNDDYLTSGVHNLDLRYKLTAGGGIPEIQFRRSNVDCISIEFSLDKMKTILGPDADNLTYDKLAIDWAEDDSYNFNAILLYYSVYNKSLDKTLATNLLGILFLDAPSGNTLNYGPGGMEIIIPSITKLQSGPTGFGTSYSFRLNIKSDYMMDDTQAIVTDTTSANNIEDFSSLFNNLGRTLSILNQQTGTINFITEQYLDLGTQQTNILNEINDLQYQINDIARDIGGTDNTIAMFADGDDPIVDSSIYMKFGKIGLFTNDPKWPVQIDASLKTKDIYLQSAIRDTSGNILLGYGSPMQIGSSTNYRDIHVYTGGEDALMSFDSSDNVTVAGKLNVTGLFSINNQNLNLPQVITDPSLSNDFYWAGGRLNINISDVCTGLSLEYIDSSLIQRDVRMDGIDQSINDLSIVVYGDISDLNDVSIRVDNIETDVNNIDSSILTLDSIKANKNSPVFSTLMQLGDWKLVIVPDTSLVGTNLVLSYMDNSLFMFTNIGQFYALGDVSSNSDIMQ